MNRDLIINIIRFVLLALIQVLILNRIQLAGYLNPFLYVLFILLLPVETPGWLLLTSSFLMGLSIDLFSETGGIHAAASTFIAFLRPTVFRLVSSKSDFEGVLEPNISDMGFAWFTRYALILIVVHHLSFFLIEAGRWSDIPSVLYRTLLSVPFTFFLVIISQYLFFRRKQ